MGARDRGEPRSSNLRGVRTKEEQMAEISRRKFLIRGGTGAAALGALAVLPPFALPEPPAKGDAPQAGHAAATTAGTAGSGHSLVAYVPDPPSGEVHYMFGTKEVVVKDRELVARLLHDAR
jgi:hypothetical protein